MWLISICRTKNHKTLIAFIAQQAYNNSCKYKNEYFN